MSSFVPHLSSLALPALAAFAPDPQALAQGEREVAQRILAEVSLRCEQERVCCQGDDREGHGFWSFLRQIRA